MPEKSFLDPVTIAQLGKLELRARRILDGLYSGHHPNVIRGHSQDFSEHRPYNPGDDPRGLDWKIFGKTDRLVVKQFEEQTNIGATVIIDDSKSMDFSFGGLPSKLEYAKTMAAALGYLVVHQHDAIGLLTRGSYLAPGSERGHLEQYFETLESIRAEGVWDINDLGKRLARPLKKRGFVFLFSDLMEKTEQVLSSLRSLNAHKQEVLVFQILDPAEIDLPFEGSILFQDMETKELIKTEPAAIRDSYRRWVKAHLDSYKQIFRSAGMDYVVLTTDTPFDRGLGAFLSWRGERS